MPSHSPRTALWALPALLPLAVATAQEWTPATDSLRVQSTPIAHDPLRNRSVALGSGGQTWEHDGRTWLRTARLGVNLQRPASVVYQPNRGRVLGCVFEPTGAEGGAVFTTVEYDGFAWRRRSPDHSPPARGNTHLAYDSARQRVVLFSGSVTADDTWEWDGQDWLRRLPAVKPPARTEAAFAYDAGRGVCVLVGGRNQGAVLSDHWEWNGSTWTQRTNALPPARSHSQLAYDANRGRLVLYGGFPAVPTTPMLDPLPWEFDGVAWSQRAIAGAPTGRWDHSMVAVPGGVRIFGGATGAFLPEARFDVYDYDGSRFVPRGRPFATGIAAAKEPGGDVLVLAQVAGQSATYRWNGTELLRVLSPGVAPQGRSLTAMAPGAAGDVIAFGGLATSGVALADTWRFQAGQWQQLAVSGPSPRFGHAMAFDPRRGRVVLFGGTSVSGTQFADLWEWDGAAWQQRQPSGAAPGAMAYAGMAFASDVDRIVLHGASPGRFSAETWDWDGTAWALVEDALPIVDFAALQWSPLHGSLQMVRSALGGLQIRAFALARGTGWVALTEVPPIEVRPGCLDVDRYGSLIAVGGDDLLSIHTRSAQPALLLRTPQGCSAVGSAPRVVSHDLPRAGREVRLELLGAAPAQLAVLFLSTTFGNLRIGACSTTLAQPEVVQLAPTNAAGQLQQPFAIPNLAALVGVDVGFQALTTEVQGPVFGAFALSDGLSLRIGR